MTRHVSGGFDSGAGSAGHEFTERGGIDTCALCGDSFVHGRAIEEPCEGVELTLDDGFAARWAEATTSSARPLPWAWDNGGDRYTITEHDVAFEVCPAGDAWAAIELTPAGRTDLGHHLHASDAMRACVRALGLDPVTHMWPVLTRGAR